MPDLRLFVGAVHVVMFGCLLPTRKLLLMPVTGNLQSVSFYWYYQEVTGHFVTVLGIARIEQVVD